MIIFDGRVSLSRRRVAFFGTMRFYRTGFSFLLKGHERHDQHERTNQFAKPAAGTDLDLSRVQEMFACKALGIRSGSWWRQV